VPCMVNLPLSDWSDGVPEDWSVGSSRFLIISFPDAFRMCSTSTEYAALVSLYETGKVRAERRAGTRRVPLSDNAMQLPPQFKPNFKIQMKSQNTGWTIF